MTPIRKGSELSSIGRAFDCSGFAPLISKGRWFDSSSSEKQKISYGLFFVFY